MSQGVSDTTFIDILREQQQDQLSDISSSQASVSEIVADTHKPTRSKPPQNSPVVTDLIMLS